VASRYRLTPAAIADLDDVVEYLQAFDPIAAVRFVESAQATFEHLGYAPQAYPRYSSTSPRTADLRWRPLTGAFGKYLVFYRVEPDGPVIIRVIHSARDLGTVLDE
jgi:toxin ParE1/3/4